MLFVSCVQLFLTSWTAARELSCPSPSPWVCSNSCPLWRRQWQHTPVLLPGKSHGWGSLVGCSPWGHEESETTSNFTFNFHFHALEKEIATHSSVLAWRTPGMGEPGGRPSMGSHRVRHDWSGLAATAAAAACPLCCWCHPTISSSVVPFSSIFPSIRVIYNESAFRIRWPKY